MKQKPDYLNNMPEPKTEKAGSFKLAITALLALLILSGAGYWLTRGIDEKERLRASAVDTVSGWLADTPAAFIADWLKPAPEPLPEQVTNPTTLSGTLAGQHVTATVAAPMDFGPGIDANQLLLPRANPAGENAAEADQGNGQVQFDQEPLPPVTEDSRLKPAYIAGLAQWLASRYQPGPQGGALNASAQALNQAGGGALASHAEGGRGGLLRYAFHPAMINGLYRLYIDRFMSDLDEAARKKGLDASQNRQFHRAIAGRAALLAASLDGALRVGDLSKKLAHIDDLAQKTVDANADLTTAVFELDELRNARASQQLIGAGQMRVDGAQARYKRAADDLARAHTALASEIRRYSGQNMDEDSLLFIAAWVARRYAQGGQARGALESCVACLRDLSARCARFGEGA